MKENIASLAAICYILSFFSRKTESVMIIYITLILIAILIPMSIYYLVTSFIAFRKGNEKVTSLLLWISVLIMSVLTLIDLTPWIYLFRFSDFL